MGAWKALRKRVTLDASSGYTCLDPMWESIHSASLQGIPIDIQTIDAETRMNGWGEITRPVAHSVGILDMEMQPLMSDLPEDGATEFVFSSATNTAFAANDVVTITYTDADDGYTQVALPLNTISTTISSAATYDSGAATNLAVTSSTGLVVNAGVTISGASNVAYDGNWRVVAVPDATHVVISKTYVAGAITGTIATNKRLQPASEITEVDSIVYASLPSRVLMKDDDDIQYAILLAGDGAAQFHRYEVPQVPENAVSGEWDLIAVLKRSHVNLTATTDLVYLDSIPVLTSAVKAIVQRDAGNHEEELLLWAKCQKELDRELNDHKGGAISVPSVEIWGPGIPPLQSHY